MYNNQVNPGQPQRSSQMNNLTYYHEYHVATRFGVTFALVSEDKIGKDGVAYRKYSVLIRVIPPGNEPMTYDSSNAFTMKTSVEQVAALSGALLAAYHGLPVNFTIFTDSSKSQFTNETSQKMFYVNNIDKKTNNVTDKVSVGALLKENNFNKVSTGVSLSIFDAYAWHKLLDRFVDGIMNIIFKESVERSKSRGV